MEGVCGKVNCRNENGQKLCIILVASNLQTLKVSETYSSSNNVDDSLNYSSDSSVASCMVDNIDIANDLPVTVNNDKVIVVALWLKLALWFNNGKWFAGIYTVGKKFLLYVG